MEGFVPVDLLHRLDEVVKGGRPERSSRRAPLRRQPAPLVFDRQKTDHPRWNNTSYAFWRGGRAFSGRIRNFEDSAGKYGKNAR
jgi:hypothetical protein